MRHSTLKMSAFVLAITGVVGVATPSLAGGATSAVIKKSPNAYQAQSSSRYTGSIEFSSAARTPTSQKNTSDRAR
jgi:hypothetical protein